MATEFHYKDAGVWRKLKEFWYKDSGVWRKCKEVWYKDAGTWRKVFTGEVPILFTGAGDEGGGGVMRFLSNGTVLGNNGTASTNSYLGNWHSPTTTGIGNSRWIRFSNLDISTSLQGGMVVGTWYSLSTERSFFGSLEGSGFSAIIDIATDSGGTNIILTGGVRMYYGGS